MRKILMLLAIGIAISSCNQRKDSEYVINGNAEDVHNGIRVRLAQIDEKGQQVIKDSAIVMDNKFTIKGSVDEPGIYFLSADGSPGNVVFMLENSDITIDFNKQIPMESKVTGSESNKSYEAFQNGMLQFKEEGGAIMTKFRELGNEPAPEQRDSIKNVMEDLRERQRAYPLKFVQENNDSYFSLNLIQLESSRAGFDILKYQEAFESFPDYLKNSNRGQIVKQKLDELYKAYEKTAYLEIGKIAPNFESQTPDGKVVSLNDLRGKVTIIDFWAAWCGPCRRENPNVVKVYEQYHDKGLEIIGVSLDGAPNQKDPKKAWLDAIEKDGLEWHHVSSLKYFNDDVAKLYNIESIPATYILDEEGKIVAKNLRGFALERKVRQLILDL
ncbi:TlpA disulfide reductase family protein [Winogradskyella aquimaris]|uniref:TlpA disulfide reductase family protein n=1 Tax=Winogradskyella aquimaris TaxID=864074 RepID=A0ABU5EMQ4_9FLAO|nr:TlpA disulfide reductase family protein [Winogradskyella aquimaris]MDY2586805.1 TlpA disulfide reductase family protein [Winogradskyella aquimaris]